MKTSRRRLTGRSLGGALLLMCGAALLAMPAFAAEWELATPYYEDDAWYDVSEWFDGNDYNPTDEAFGRWDNETYDVSEDIGTDQDNDTWYGYNTLNDDDNWYYDYYDTGYYDYSDREDDGLYEYTSRYYDYDNDGAYDALVTYWNTDDDFAYDTVNYYFFTEDGTKQQQEKTKKQAPQTAARQRVSGEIASTKRVRVRGGENLVVRVEKNDKTIAVDLGRADKLRNLKLKEGQNITATGPLATVGRMQVLLAKEFQADGKSRKIDREPRTIQGTVKDTHKRKVRGSNHLLAMVKLKEGGKTVAVDLGPADELKFDVEKGESIEFTGVPVKVNDKRLLLARTLKQDGKTIPIRRQQQNKQSKQKKS